MYQTFTTFTPGLRKNVKSGTENWNASSLTGIKFA